MNSSARIAADVSQAMPDIQTLELPNSFDECRKKLTSNTPEWGEYDLVLALGQSGDGSCLRIERYAHNWIDASSRPDADGRQPVGDTVLEGAPICLQSNVDLAALQRFATQQGLPLTISTSAGTQLCNFVYYLLLTIRSSSPTAFVHIPYLTDQIPGRLGFVNSITMESASTTLRNVVLHLIDRLERDAARHKE